MKRPRTILRSAIRSAVLGLLTTLVTCWVLPGALYGLLSSSWYSDQRVVQGVTHDVVWSRTLLRDHVKTENVATSRSRLPPHKALPSWYTAPDSFADYAREDTYAAGFPMRAMICRPTYVARWVQGGWHLHRVHGGIELASRSDRLGIIPLKPIWPGLLADIAIWSVAWFALMTLVSGVRMWRARRRAGRCPKCRYDLAGLPDGTPCPECGHRSSHLAKG